MFKEPFQIFLVITFLAEPNSLPDPAPYASPEVPETDAAETPTEDMINKMIDEFQLYRDPYLTDVITECYGRTPLHIAVTDRRKDVVNCFIDFRGRLQECIRL